MKFMNTLDELEEQTASLLEEFFFYFSFNCGDILVIGCSTSEVLGHQIGTYSSKEAGEAIIRGALRITQKFCVFLAAQCCEHLNRAIILEEKAASLYHLEPVNVIPQPKAGGSFATAAYYSFQKPVAVEHIQAHAGIDIGDTFIGMHLKPVAVPIRLTTKTLGYAHICAARTRPKFIGGSRACYDETII